MKIKKIDAESINKIFEKTQGLNSVFEKTSSDLNTYGECCIHFKEIDGELKFERINPNTLRTNKEILTAGQIIALGNYLCDFDADLTFEQNLSDAYICETYENCDDEVIKEDIKNLARIIDIAIKDAISEEKRT